VWAQAFVCFAALAVLRSQAAACAVQVSLDRVLEEVCSSHSLVRRAAAAGLPAASGNARGRERSQPVWMCREWV
jgi:hypothetical protein